MERVVLVACLLAVASVVGADYAKYTEFLQQQRHNKTFIHLLNEHIKSWERHQTPPTLMRNFPCEIPTPTVPATSVNKLTPSDIKVVAALGDSITAGTGIDALTVIGLFLEYRGKSWSIGGDGDFEEVITIPNVLKKYNPDLKGFSLGIGGVNSRHAHLNVADPGDISQDMKGQAELLVERLNSEPGVDMQNDWKVITLFIGGNDLCDYCIDDETYSPANYVNHVKQALDILHANVPRAFVNVVPVLNIVVLKELNENFVCTALHLYLCRCAAFPNGEEEEKMRQGILAYQQQLTDLVTSGVYEKEDFAVVIQPFFTDTQLPRTEDGKPDMRYFAPDCFHLSRDGHQAAATALWNNMLQPVGTKAPSWEPGEVVDCPTEEHRFFYTNQNSHTDVGLTYEQEKGDGDSGEQDISTSTTAVIVGVCVSVLVSVAVAVVIYKRKSKVRHSYTEI